MKKEDLAITLKCSAISWTTVFLPDEIQGAYRIKIALWVLQSRNVVIWVRKDCLHIKDLILQPFLKACLKGFNSRHQNNSQKYLHEQLYKHTSATSDSTLSLASESEEASSKGKSRQMIKNPK